MDGRGHYSLIQLENWQFIFSRSSLQKTAIQPARHLPNERHEDIRVISINFAESQLGALRPHIQRIVKDPAYRARAVVHVDRSL